MAEYLWRCYVRSSCRPCWNTQARRYVAAAICLIVRRRRPFPLPRSSSRVWR